MEVIVISIFFAIFLFVIFFFMVLKRNIDLNNIGLRKENSEIVFNNFPLESFSNSFGKPFFKPRSIFHTTANNLDVYCFDVFISVIAGSSTWPKRMTCFVVFPMDLNFSDFEIKRISMQESGKTDKRYKYFKGNKNLLINESFEERNKDEFIDECAKFLLSRVCSQNTIIKFIKGKGLVIYTMDRFLKIRDLNEVVIAIGGSFGIKKYSLGRENI